jgi:hypothetical protein
MREKGQRVAPNLLLPEMLAGEATEEISGGMAGHKRDDDPADRH